MRPAFLRLVAGRAERLASRMALLPVRGSPLLAPGEPQKAPLPPGGIQHYIAAMATSGLDIKLLWGRAAGRCSKPGCTEELTRLAERGSDYIIGEMAHVIAKAKEGPRGDGVGGDDSYDNLMLLCPTHHREVDKAPEGEFPVEMLREWKAGHEEKVHRWGEEERYGTFDDMKKITSLLLAENRITWKELGPKSEVAQRSPGSNAFDLWELRRADKIVPNNRRMMNLIRANVGLLNKEQTLAFAEFANHAESYEAHVYERRDHYPLFPEVFAEAFG